MQKVVA